MKGGPGKQLIPVALLMVASFVAAITGWNFAVPRVSEFVGDLHVSVQPESGAEKPGPVVVAESRSPLAAPPPPQGERRPDFNEAKRLLRQVHERFPFEVYCGCQFINGRDLTEECGFRSRSYASRSSRIEWEHVVPASHFGQQRPCWRDAPGGTSGRKWCERTDPDFAAMEGDPFNLLPALGSLNAVRSNHRFGEIPGESREFGTCDFEYQDGVVEPPSFIKGDVARIYFYFEDRYGHRISDSQRQLFLAWHAEDPVDSYESLRAQDIARSVRWGNPYATGERSPH